MQNSRPIKDQLKNYDNFVEEDFGDSNNFGEGNFDAKSASVPLDNFVEEDFDGEQIETPPRPQSQLGPKGETAEAAVQRLISEYGPKDEDSVEEAASGNEPETEASALVEESSPTEVPAPVVPVENTVLDRKYSPAEMHETFSRMQIEQKEKAALETPIIPVNGNITKSVDADTAEKAKFKLTIPEDERAMADQVKLKQGEEIPEPVANPYPIDQDLKHELEEGVDEIAREEEGIKPNDIHSEESQLEAAEQEELQSYPLYLEDGSVITIVKNQSWLMAGEPKVITSIRLGPDKSSLFIGFNDHPSEQRTTDEWKTAFESSKLLGDGVHELERARIGDVESYKTAEKTEAKYQTREVSPIEAAGVKNIHDGKEIVAEEVHIPAVAVEGAEVAEVSDPVAQAAETENLRKVEEQQHIIAKAVETVPGAGDAVVAEEKRERGEAEAKEPQTSQQVHAKVLAGDNPDQADTSFAKSIEDQIEAAQDTGVSPEE